MSALASAASVDVRYWYDELPSWAVDLDELPSAPHHLVGRATGSSDRGQRSAVVYDARGNAVWGARQMAFISDEVTLTPGTRPSWDDRPAVVEAAPLPAYVEYDESNSYVRTAEFDHANRGTAIVLPRDPDFDSVAPAPLIRGTLTYNRRGLPHSASVQIGNAANQPIVRSIAYTRDGLPAEVVLGDGPELTSTRSTTDYDARRRPVRMRTTRTPRDLNAAPESLEAVTVVADQELEWDPASNLTDIVDRRAPSEWPAGHQPQTIRSQHDALYRVIAADFEYGASPTAGDLATDWRDEQTRVRSAGADPMDTRPAPMLPSLPSERVRSLTWSWDWLANMTEWTDDQNSFYERSLGMIANGQSAPMRPSALYFAVNLPFYDPSAPVGPGGGWLEVEYGAGGNVIGRTARAQCVARPGAASCDPPSGDGEAAMQSTHEFLSCQWQCASEQHFEYRWDELNRLAEARRWDRAGSGAWDLAVRQRYRYDGANQRTLKQTLDPHVPGAERIALYVYPGDYERRGLVRTLDHDYAPADGRSETQYLVAGARIVWQHDTATNLASERRNRRITMAVADLLGTTSAVLDLPTGELLETSTYYPNGARETYRAASTDPQLASADPVGFTGKEADEEVGVTYFGERYLAPRIARWATPDPLHVHATEGGEACNGYHYVSGNMLQARDPLGLWPDRGESVVMRSEQREFARLRERYAPLRGEFAQFRADSGSVAALAGLVRGTRSPGSQVDRVMTDTQQGST